VHRTPHRLVATLTLALQLALSFGLGANLVLCTDAGGHTAVESAYEADCCDDHVLPPGARSVAGDDGCGCVDRPIVQAPADVRQRLESAAPSVIHPLPASFAAHLVSPSLRCGPAPVRPSRVPVGAATGLRSVVLLV
jgi:hypothetical protein